MPAGCQTANEATFPACPCPQRLHSNISQLLSKLPWCGLQSCYVMHVEEWNG